MAAGFQAPGLLNLGLQQQQQQQQSSIGIPQATVHPQSNTVLTIGQTTAGPTLGGQSLGLTGLGTNTANTGLTGLKTGTNTTGLTTGLTGLGQTGLTGLKTGLGGVATSRPTVQPTLQQTGLTGLTGTVTGLGATGQPTGLTGQTTGLTTGLGTTGQTKLTGLGTTGLMTGLPTGQPTGLTTGLGGTSQTGLTGIRTSNTITGLGGGGVATTASHVTGLGGASNGVTSKTKVKSVSEGDVPVELSQLITQFESFMKKQKERSDEISKSSESFEKKFRSLGDDIDTHKKQAITVTQQLHQLNNSLSLLKEENTKESQVVEIAQRTRELPAGLQHENTAPDEYFQKTVFHFEKRMQVFRHQLEELESYLNIFSTTHHNTMDSGDILGALDAQYKPFLLLAARLQVVHEEIQRLKEQYINMRRLMGLDTTDLFITNTLQQQQIRGNDKKTLDIQTGPSPFAASISQATAALTAMATAGGGGTVTGTTGLGGMGMNLGGMGTSLGGLGMSSGLGGANLGGMGTGLGRGIGMGTNLGGIGMGTNLGGMGMNLGGIGTNPTGMGMNLGGGGTGLSVAGTTKPFQLKPPPMGKRKT